MLKFTKLLGYFPIIFTLIVCGCGASKDEKTAEAVLSANILLTQGKCSDAIAVLEANGRVNDNSIYLQTLSSAYACLNGYREPSFFANDLSKTNTPSPIGGMALYSNASNMTSATDSDFTNMQKAIDILIYAGGLSTDINPSCSLRSAKFTEAESLDLHTQLLLEVLEQLGRFYRYYGNSSATGVKGSGTDASGNTCFVSYENVPLDVGVDLTTYLGTGATGACVAIGSGHNDFGAANAFTTARLCQGVVLMNTLFDLLPNVLGSSTSSDFSVIQTLQTTITSLRTALSTAKVGTSDVLVVTSQSLCESQNAANDDFIQVYYAFIFEPLFL